MTHKINHDWDPYYQILEAIRISGITNMFGAAPYLKAWAEDEDLADITDKTASDILCSWIANYSDLAEYFDWRTTYHIDAEIVTEQTFKIFLAHDLMSEAIHDAEANGVTIDFDEITEQSFKEVADLTTYLRATGEPEVVNMHSFRICHLS